MSKAIQNLKRDLDLIGPAVESILEQSAGEEVAFSLIIHPLDMSDKILHVSNANKSRALTNLKIFCGQQTLELMNAH